MDESGFGFVDNFEEYQNDIRRRVENFTESGVKDILSKNRDKSRTSLFVDKKESNCSDELKEMHDACYKETTVEHYAAITQQIEIPEKKKNKQVEWRDDIEEIFYFEYDKDERENVSKKLLHISYLKHLEYCAKEILSSKYVINTFENRKKEPRVVINEYEKRSFLNEGLGESELFYIREIQFQVKRFKNEFYQLKTLFTKFVDCYGYFPLTKLVENDSFNEYYKKLDDAIHYGKAFFKDVEQAMNALSWLLQVKNETRPSSEVFTYETFLYYQRIRFIEQVTFLCTATSNQYKHLLNFGKFIKKKLCLELMSDIDFKSDHYTIFESISNRLTSFISACIPSYEAELDSFLNIMNMFLKTSRDAAESNLNTE